MRSFEQKKQNLRLIILMIIVLFPNSYLSANEINVNVNENNEDQNIEQIETTLGLDYYNKHFSNFLGGRAEGVYFVKINDCKVYLGPDSRFDIVGMLKKNSYVHAISIKNNEWVKIGRSQYVRLENIQSAGIKTKGISEALK